MRTLVLALFATACRSSPSCEAVGDHVLSLLSPPDDHAYELRGAIVTRCSEDEWPPAARRCILDTSSLDAPQHCRQELSLEQSMKLDSAVSALEAAERARTMPQACLDYESLVGAIQRCDQAPADLRQTLANNLADAKAAWGALADKSTLAPTCASAIEAVEQVVPASCRQGSKTVP